MTKSKREASRPSQLSEEKIIDSDSDEAEKSVSDSDSALTKQAVSAKTLVAKNKAFPGNALRQDIELDSISDTGSESGANDLEEDGEEETSKSSSSDETLTKRSSQNSKSTIPRKKTQPAVPTPIAPRAYRPPDGFEKTTFASSDSPSDSTQFLSRNLTEKKVWHFTAPATLNIHEIQTLRIQDVRSGKAIFSKNRVDYGFMIGSHEGENLLLATGQQVGYTPSLAKIDGTYHLREIKRRKVERDTNGISRQDPITSFATTSKISPKAPRTQPTGLKMRYQPYGSSQAAKDFCSPLAPPIFHKVPEEPRSPLEKAERKRKKKELKEKHLPLSQSNEDVMDIDIRPIPGTGIENEHLGSSTKSITGATEKQFEAAGSLDTPSKDKEKKRKKKKNRIVDEEQHT